MGTVAVYCLDSGGATLRSNIRGRAIDVLAANVSLTTAIKASDATHKYVCSGAPEQSQAADAEVFCGHGWPSFYSQLTMLSKAVGATLEPALLADVFGRLPAGMSYQLIMRELVGQAFYEGHYKYKHAIAEYDPSKISVLYFLIHTIARKHPRDTVSFELFDSNKDVLSDLESFFTAYPELIPAHVTLRLNHYTGLVLSEDAVVIQGRGLIDGDCSQTVRDMFTLVRQDKLYLIDSLEPVEELTHDKLLERHPVLGFSDGFIRYQDNFFYCDVRDESPIIALLGDVSSDGAFAEEKDVDRPFNILDKLRHLFSSLNEGKRLAMVTDPDDLGCLDLELWGSFGINRNLWSLTFLTNGLPLISLLPLSMDALKELIKTRLLRVPSTKPLPLLPPSPPPLSSPILPVSLLLSTHGAFSERRSSSSSDLSSATPPPYERSFT